MHSSLASYDEMKIKLSVFGGKLQILKSMQHFSYPPPLKIHIFAANPKLTHHV